MKRSLLRVVATSTAVLGVLLAFAVPAGAHERGIVVKSGESIQAAVDAAPPGATIYVKRGTYAENVAITKDGITLSSRGAKLVPPTTTPPATPARSETRRPTPRRLKASAWSEPSPSPTPRGGLW